jgi:tetratricopeptide (TPR) repeat protein
MNSGSFGCSLNRQFWSLVSLSLVLIALGATVGRAEDGENAFNAGNAALGRREFDTAISDFSAAIRLKLDADVAYNNRGVCHKAKGENAQAIEDFSKAIGISPNYASAFENRGLVYVIERNFAAALADFSEAVRLDPKFDRGWNNLGWVYATAPEEKFRDGTLAIACANRACTLADWKNFDWIDTLALAYAESGNFHEAIRWETACLASNTSKEKAEAMRRHLDLFNASKAYHELRESDWAGPY